MDLFHNLLWQKIKTKFTGRLVGEDAFGNKYYEERLMTGKPLRPLRRWVIYKEGAVEASNVPASWFSWLHYTSEAPIDVEGAPSWVKTHKHNQSGTPNRYVPTQSLLKDAPNETQKKPYKAWSPK